MEQTALSHAIGQALEAPAVLLAYQQAWISDDSPFKVCEKSRRTGLTWAEAADDVTIAARSREAGGMNVYYIGYNMDMAIEFIEACAMWARALQGVVAEVEQGEEVFKEGDDEKSIRTYTIRFASGFRIVALSSRPANLRGKQGVVVLDEAAFHDDLDELLKAAMALLIWGGKVRVISTHNGDANPFNVLIQDIRSGRRAGSVHRIDFSEAIEQGLFRRVTMRQRKEWSIETEAAFKMAVYKFYGDAATEELDVVPSAGSGAWLSSALIEARMVAAPVFRYSARQGFEQLPDDVRESEIQQWLDLEVLPALEALDPTLMSVLGEDFGRTGDLTDIVVGQLEQDLRRRVRFIVELRNMPHKQQTQILNFICDRLPRFVKAAVDAGGNGSAVAEFLAQKYGWGRVELIKFSESWYREQMPPLKAAFQDAMIEIPRDADVLNDLRLVKMIKGVARVPDQRTTGKDGGQRHGDSAIGIALFYYASRFPGTPIEFESTGERVAQTTYDGEPVEITDRGFGTVAGKTDLGGFQL